MYKFVSMVLNDIGLCLNGQLKSGSGFAVKARTPWLLMSSLEVKPRVNWCVTWRYSHSSTYSNTPKVQCSPTHAPIFSPLNVVLNTIGVTLVPSTGDTNSSGCHQHLLGCKWAFFPAHNFVLFLSASHPRTYNELRSTCKAMKQWSSKLIVIF